MDLINGKIKAEGFRVIGLKDTDKEKLALRGMESSFSMNEAVVEPAPEQVVDTPVPSVPEPTPVEEVQANIFDQNVPEVDTVPIESEPVQNQASENNNVFDTPVVNENEGLDTPESFFQREETPVDQEISVDQETPVDEETKLVEDDPALILSDNLRKLIEDKNSMISALNDKVNLLTEQLKNSEEARTSLEEAIKVSEAQRIAAETTLAEAKKAESSGGPSLVYQQPGQKAA